MDLYKLREEDDYAVADCELTENEEEFLHTKSQSDIM